MEVETTKVYMHVLNGLSRGPQSARPAAEGRLKRERPD